jgi:hypothetical protein
MKVIILYIGSYKNSTRTNMAFSNIRLTSC